MSPEELKMLLELSANDVGGMEDEQTRMINLASQMRDSMRPVTRGKDVGQNIGNAAYGIAGAMNDYRAGQKAPEIGGAKQKSFRSLIDSLSKKRPEDELLSLGEGSY